MKIHLLFLLFDYYFKETINKNLFVNGSVYHINLSYRFNL